jgi:glyoxylase-like metal-dependent hydrolase (beta-lactamase superfamily II)
VTRVYGGAVENVPHCTDRLVNGQKLELPKFESNDMNALVEVEAIAVPAHTRGSLVYRLRTITNSSSDDGDASKRGDGDDGRWTAATRAAAKTTAASANVEFLFTGDTIFSAGGGVPFEADAGIESDSRLARSNGNTFVRGNLGPTAMLRCFVEVMVRALPDDRSADASERILLFPGHEYTQELLARQFQNASAGPDSAGKWKNFPPRDYFETASHLYVALHRRSLPHNSGRLLMVPSTLQRELHINSHYRSLRQTGELVARAVVYWYGHFCKDKGGEEEDGALPSMMNGSGSDSTRSVRPSKGSTQQRPQSRSSSSMLSRKTPSLIKRWNLDASDVRRSVFTTVYTADLEAVIEDLSSGRIDRRHAMDQLRTMRMRMEEPVVNKRPIPGFMPTDKHIYRGICGLAVLGSRPNAMTVSDGRTMKLPPPNDYNSDRTLVSMNRLILVLTRLGLIHTADGEDISFMIRQLWREANECINPKQYQKQQEQQRNSYNGVDVESGDHWHDEVDLGMLKWLMYGVTANQPSWFSKIFCMPCSSLPQTQYVFPEHPASKMKQKSGDLVSHDVLTCYLCRDATGNVQVPTSRVESCSSDVGSIGENVTRISYREAESDDSLGLDEGHHEIEQLAASLRMQIDKNRVNT